MAKLNDEHQKQTAEASTSSFHPVPDGVYHVRLRNVDTPEQKGPSGFHYWVWEYEILDDLEFEVTDDKGNKSTQNTRGSRLWNNTSLAPQAAFAVKGTFDAFGVPYDTDTDELLGKVVKAVVSTRTIDRGARKGQLSNQIERLQPKDEGYEVPEGAGPVGVGSPAADDLF
jgi:hypothetical protein